MEFLQLEREDQIKEITAAKSPQIIFKHNTTCPISKGVLRSLKEDVEMLPPDTPFYILDLLTYRNISDEVAEKFNVKHQSPQLLLIQDGKCVYNESLYEITAEKTADAIHNNN